jgi:subtilisin family serine protease
MKTATANPRSINCLGQLLGLVVVSVIAVSPATAQPASGNAASGSPVAVKPGPAKPIVTSADHRVTVTYSAFQFDARKRVYTTRVRIKNRSGAPLLSPLRLGFNQADLRDVRLLNAHGTGMDGRPYFEFALPKKVLAAGATTQSIPIVLSIEKRREGKSPANATKADPSVFVLAQRVSAGAEWALLTPTADPYALPANSGRVTVRFSVRLVGKTKSSSAVHLRRSGDKQSVAMNDLGKNGDLIARDGILGVNVRIDTGKVRPDTCLRYEAFTRQGRVELISPPLRLCVSSFPVRIAESNTASPVTWPDGSRAVADEILLNVAPGTGAAAIRQLAATVNAKVVGSILPLNVYQLRLPAPVNANQLLEISAKLGTRTGVLSASVNAIGGYAFTPGDSEFPLQHGLQRIRAHDVWDAGANGNAVITTVLDSGIDRTHVDFGVIGDCQLAENDCGSPSTDTLGHGTQVAGVIGAKTNNGTVGIAGVAFGGKIHSIQVSATATITAAQIEAGFIAAAAYGIASVINSSISIFNAFVPDWTPVCAAIDSAVVNAGVPIAVAVNSAGNNNSNGNAAANGTFYPSRCNDVNAGLTRKDLFITVANSASVVTAACGSVAVDQRCSNSNYGSWVDIAAPGSEIRTTSLASTYVSVTGTSFSAPMVSGAAAILRSCGVPLDEIESTLRTGTHVNALPIVNVPFPDASSAPRLDIHRALLSRNRVATAVSFAPNILNENTNTSAGVEVGTLAAIDLDTCDKFTYSIVGGADAALFSIGGTNNDRLRLTSGVLDFETKPSYAVIVRVTDFAGATFDQPLTVNVTDINEAPTGVVLSNAVTSTPENGAAIKVADISIIDDALGTNVLSLSGADAASFSIVGAELRFNGGADFEVKNSYSVTVNVDDATVGATPDASQNFTLAITNVNEAPTATNLSAPETYTEDVALNLTDIVVSDVDSATVTATLTLSNPLAGSLSTATSGAVTSTYAGGVWTASGALADVNVLLAGVVFNPAANFNGNFTIATSVSDGVAAPITGSKVMTGTAVNDAPTGVVLSNAVTSTPENGAAIKVADISIIDDALGTNVLSLSGADAASFSIVGAELRFNGGANFEVKNSYSVTVNVDDATVGATPDASQIFTLAITNVNEAPTATNLSAPETYTEDVPLNLTDIVVSDVDSASVTATLTLSNSLAGSLNTATSGAVTSTYVAATGVWTASGALADVNVLLAGVVFTPELNFNGNFTIATSVSDGVAAAITGSKAMTGTAVNDAPTGLPIISGIPTEDQTLTANTGAIADADGLGPFSYQWLRGGVNIVGATSSTYILDDADVGQLISVQVTYTDGQGTPESRTSAPTTAIANINDAPTGFPTISGTLTVGQTLTAITSAIADADGLGPFSYQWMRGVADIPGQTGITYQLVAADFGTVANVRVSYTDGHGFPESRTSVNATNTGDPHITTVDGLHYDFQAAGEFVTLRGANGMEIQTRQTPVSTAAPIADSHSGLSVGVSVNTAVAARVGTHRVTLQPNISGLPAASGLELRVDGVLTTLPANGINFGSGARVVPLPGGAIQVDFPDGTTMVVTPGFWTSHNVWYLNVSVFHTSASEGIMGARYQGSWLPRLGDGTALGARPAALHDRYVELYEKFANSWRVKKETSLFDYAQGTSTETFTLASWPQENPPFVVPQGGKVTKPIDRKIAQQQCRAVVGKNQNADCVFDVMVAGNRGFARTYLQEQKIQGGLTATVLRDDKAKTRPHEPVTFTATVVRSAVLRGLVQRSAEGKSKPHGQVIPTGAVQFTLDGKNVGKPVRLDAKGQARVKMSRRQLGTRQIAARYLPARGSVFLASSSLEGPRKVTKRKD